MAPEESENVAFQLNPMIGMTKEQGDEYLDRWGLLYILCLKAWTLAHWCQNTSEGF